MPNVIAELQAVLTTSNNLVSPAPYIGNFDLGNPTMGANSFYSDVFQALTGGVPIPFPIVPIFCLIIQNISITGQVLQVTVTPFGGGPQIYSYGPKGIFAHFDPLETGLGIAAATVTGIAGTVPAYVFVGA